MVDAQTLHDKPENERNKESVIVEMKNYIRRIRSMAMEVRKINRGSNIFSFTIQILSSVVCLIDYS